MLQRLKDAAVENLYLFAMQMDAVRCCNLGQIAHALFEVRGQYRRSM